MDIIVLVKQVPDTEGTPSDYEIDSQNKKVIPRGIPPVISPFDENALEVAICIKETHGGKIIAMSAGENLSKAVLIKALAMGADELVLVQDKIFENIDARSIALVLSKAIEKTGKYDLIFAGRQAGDWDQGQVGLMVAEILDIACITLARKVDIENGTIRIEKVVPGGYEIIRAGMPALITVSNEAGEPRYASIRTIKAAKEKPIKSLSAKDIGIDPSDLSKRELVKLFAPDWKKECTFIPGGDPREKGVNLALMLKEKGLI